MNFYVKEVLEKELAGMRKNHKMVSFDFNPMFKNFPSVKVSVHRDTRRKQWLMIFDFGSAGFVMTEAGIIHVKNPTNPSELFDGCKIENLNEAMLVVSTVDCNVEELFGPVNSWLCHVCTVLEKENVLIRKIFQEK